MDISTVTRLLTALAAAIALFPFSALAGFQVSGTQLLDGNGEPFVMRGINHPHAWYPGNTDAIAQIAGTGANTVRLVLSDGQQWNRTSAGEIRDLIALCKANQLICILEVHDVTGSGESADAGDLATAAQFWVSNAAALQGQEDYVIINIANEPFGNNLPASAWIDGHRAAIETLRSAGLTHTLLVDAANWGQDWEQIMLQNATQVASADPLANTMFAVHMYEVYQDRSTIENYVNTFLNDHDLPLIVGEFGSDHQGNFVDADSIMAVAEQYKIGYLGWSWSGNGSCCTALDIVNDFNAASLTDWGELLINGVNGIVATAQTASIYTAAPNPGSTSSSSSSASTDGSSSSVSSSVSSGASSSGASSSVAGGGAGATGGWMLAWLLILVWHRLRPGRRAN